ncbi:MAG: hypothetical protein IPO21_08535 [Bacteroidales bacterium]|nr:hypothetical protein [Bacteroidales bacterium]
MKLTANSVLFKVIYVLFSVLILSACSGGGEEDSTLEIPDSVKNAPTQKMKQVGQAVIDDLVQNVSSPIEMAALIKKAGVPFSKDYLSDPDLVDKYNSTFDKALNLGVYGADLGYLNMYNKTSLIINHITTIKKLTEALKIGQFFDFSTLKRLASNNENLDSLMYISTSSFNKMDRYLRESNRSNASTLMVAGVWIEGLFLATQVADKVKTKEINERIAEQKISLNDLIIVLKVYNNEPGFGELIGYFEEIKSAFDPIKIAVEMGEPEMIENDKGELIIKQNDKQTVTIPEGQMEKIIEVTARVRNLVIKK